MISKIYLSVVGFVVMSGLSSNALPQDSDIRGCWRQESHVFSLIDGSSRQEKARCVNYFGDTEVSVACNWISDPDYRSTWSYQVKKQDEVSILSLGKDPYVQESEYEIRKGEMVITSRYQRPSKIGANEFASSKTSVLARLKFADRETCLSQAKLISQEVIKAVELAPGVVDFPRPFSKAKIKIADLGSIRWLDADHLALTVTDAERSYGRGKIVSVNIRNQSITTIAESGILRCTNPEAALVALTKGEVIRGSDSSSADVFYRWDGVRNALVDEEKPPKPFQNGWYWNWDVCSQTTLDDAKKTELDFLKKFTGRTYLRAEDGLLNWNSSPPPPEGFTVSLVTPRGVRKLLDLKSLEVIGIPTYLPFLKSYVLSGGRFITGGGKFDYAGKKVEQIPLVTLSHDGAVIRSYIPTSLKIFLSKWNSSGQIFPATDGLLIYVDGIASQGAGIYLSKGDSATRIWCSPLNHSGDSCGLGALEISPDGCNVVIAPKNQASESPIVLPICGKKVI